MIFLVVLYHTGGVYESSGIWSSFWRIEDPSTNDLASFNKCIYLLGNKNIFEPKKLRLLQLIATKPKLQISTTKTKYLVISDFACIVNIYAELTDRQNL